MVPTLVPIDSETKQAAMNSPASSICGGSRASVRFTVASTAPVTFAELAKAPASTKIHIISIIWGVPAPRLNTLMRRFREPRIVATA